MAGTITSRSPISHAEIEAIREAMPAFGSKIRGFDRHDAVFTGVETRTSSPLRITRGDALQSLNVRGLYPAGEGAGNVTYGEAFTIQPFGNSLVTLTLTAQQLKDVLEQQFAGCRGAGSTRHARRASSARKRSKPSGPVKIACRPFRCTTPMACPSERSNNTRSPRCASLTGTSAKLCAAARYTTASSSVLPAPVMAAIAVAALAES